MVAGHSCTSPKSPLGGCPEEGCGEEAPTCLTIAIIGYELPAPVRAERPVGAEPGDFGA